MTSPPKPQVLEAIEVHDKLPPSERGTRLVQPRNDNKLVKKNERVGEKDLGAGAIVAEMLALEESLLPLLKVVPPPPPPPPPPHRPMTTIIHVPHRRRAPRGSPTPMCGGSGARA